MGRDDHREVLFDHERLQPFEGRDVEVVRRLIEQQQVRIVEQESGEAETRALAPGERADLAVAQGVEAEAREHPSERRLEVISAGVVVVVLRIRVALEQLRIAGRELVLHRAELLLERCEVRRRTPGMLLDRAVDVDEQLLLQESDARAAGERDRSAVRRVETGNDPKQRRFAGAVRSDEARAVTAREAEADVAEQDAIGEAPTGGLDREDAHSGEVTCQCICGVTPGALAFAVSLTPSLPIFRRTATSCTAPIIATRSTGSRASGPSRDGMWRFGMMTTWRGAIGRG